MNSEHIEILKQGVEVWNTWREANPDIEPDLSRIDTVIGILTTLDFKGANLSRTNLDRVTLLYHDLSYVNFFGANLCDAILPGARLDSVNLQNADLSNADLNGATFNNVDLSGANLNGINLSNASLNEANFRGVNLSHANLTRAHLLGADLTGANLSNVDLRRAELSGAYINYLDYAELDTSGWDEGIYDKAANLSGADLKGANLNGVNLSQVDLHDADLRGADLSETDLRETCLSGAKLNGAKLINASLVGTKLKSADISECHVYGISVWNVQLENTTQLNLRTTPLDEPELTVDNIELAQVIYLMINNANLRNVIDTVTSKVVLILGRFTSKRKAVLDALRDKLRKHNYIPVVFDFDPSAQRNLIETVSTLAHMARFIIADITDAKSIPDELRAIVPALPSVPVQPLLHTRSKAYATFDAFKDCPWVLNTFRYSSTKQLLASLEDHLIAPAERRIKEVSKG